MTTVTFPTALGGDGSTVSDDNDPVTGLGNGGHRTRFVPSLKNIVAIAQMVVNTTTNLASKASQVDLNATNAELDSLTAVVGTKADSSSVSSSISTINSSLALKAPLASPAFTGGPTAPTPASTDTGTRVATKDYADGVGVPIGGIVMLGPRSLPANFILVPTAATAISRTAYAKLFAEYGTSIGSGDGSTTFNIPFMPPDYAPIMAALLADVGTASVGEVISHLHAVLANGAETQGGRIGIGGAAVEASYPTELTGGAANKAAGVRFQFAIRYR